MRDQDRKLAVGWFDNKSFTDVCRPYLRRVKEVFFAWPGVTASRPMDDWTVARRARIVGDLKWARDNGVELDTIFNANCYGDLSMTEALADHVTEKLREMDGEGLFPDHLTTTSPFIAKVVRQRFPSVKIRFSINMDIATPVALGYVDDLFDSFYAGRNNHRRIDYVREMAAWAHAHGKTIGVQANPGCLRNCPFHTFHNNLHGHNRVGQSAAAEKFGFTNFLCRTVFERGRYEEFLRAIWIRPEDLPRYEELVDVVKLATRRHPNPDKILAAYANRAYSGDLAEIMDPFYRFPKIIDNDALGASPLWPAVRDCPDADHCRDCGKCRRLLAESSKDRPAAEGDLSGVFRGFFKG
ncbi:MAG: hypothetical protein IJ829_07200 [Kiritimatiellae bacterium]|nr:hypothetical protein [Kiritimatiellia bacterium]